MSAVAACYAQALFTLVKDNRTHTRILRDLELVDHIFSQEVGFYQLLRMPNLTRKQRCEMIDDCFSKVIHPYVCNMMKLLVEKGFLQLFSDCCNRYREQYYATYNTLEVLAVSATELTEKQTQMLKNKLKKITGKTIFLRNELDRSCVGGVRLHYGGRCVDGTVRRRLQNMEVLLKNNVL